MCGYCLDFKQFWGNYEMQKIIKFKKDDLVWVPRIAIALWSRPGTEFTEGLWNTGIIVEAYEDGNIKVLVDGKLELSHKNFIRHVV